MEGESRDGKARRTLANEDPKTSEGLLHIGGMGIRLHIVGGTMNGGLESNAGG
jgi:hypothetical protein